jgi:hypothetical protein
MQKSGKETGRMFKMYQSKISGWSLAVALIASGLSLSHLSFAGGGEGSGQMPGPPAQLIACFKQDNIELPSPGTAPTAAQAAELQKCMPGSPPSRGGMQKLKSCFDNDNVTMPNPGAAPTDAQKAEMDKCRSQATANSISSQAGGCGSNGSSCGSNYQTPGLGSSDSGQATTSGNTQ